MLNAFHRSMNSWMIARGVMFSLATGGVHLVDDPVDRPGCLQLLVLLLSPVHQAHEALDEVLGGPRHGDAGEGILADDHADEGEASRAPGVLAQPPHQCVFDDLEDFDRRVDQELPDDPDRFRELIPDAGERLHRREEVLHGDEVPDARDRRLEERVRPAEYGDAPIDPRRDLLEGPRVLHLGPLLAARLRDFQERGQDRGAVPLDGLIGGGIESERHGEQRVQIGDARPHERADLADHHPLDHFQEFRGRPGDEPDDVLDRAAEELGDAVHHPVGIADIAEREAVPEADEAGADAGRHGAQVVDAALQPQRDVVVDAQASHERPEHVAEGKEVQPRFEQGGSGQWCGRPGDGIFTEDEAQHPVTRDVADEIAYLAEQPFLGRVQSAFHPGGGFADGAADGVPRVAEPAALDAAVDERLNDRRRPRRTAAAQAHGLTLHGSAVEPGGLGVPGDRRLWHHRDLVGRPRGGRRVGRLLAAGEGTVDVEFAGGRSRRFLLLILILLPGVDLRRGTGGRRRGGGAIDRGVDLRRHGIGLTL
jgi:hypothetical protein